MELEEKKDVYRLKKDFSRLKNKKEFTKQDEDKLITDVAGLLGVYAVDKRKETASLIEEMLAFAEEKNWAVQGSRIEFDRIKKGKFRVKR